MTTGREEQGSVGDWEAGGGEIDWGEREPDRVEKVSRGRGCEDPSSYRDTSQERTALFPHSLFCLTRTASSLLIGKDITGQLQLRPLTSALCCYIPRLIYACLILGVNLGNGGGKALLAIRSTSKGYIDSEQRGHWGKLFPLFLANGV